MTFLTDDQFQALKEFIYASIDEAIEEKQLVRKVDLSYLPTKEDFYIKMDEITGKLDLIINENKILNSRSSENRDRIENLETIHPSGKHISN